MSDFEFEKPKRGRPAKQEEAVLEQQPVDDKDEAEKKDSPAQKPKYDKDELLRVFDEIIFEGEYMEDVTIRGKLKVKFKTRSAEEISEISRTLDSTQYNLVTTLTESRYILNLEYALIEYQGRPLGMMKHEERAKFIGKLPAPVIGVLIDALINFDNKVAEACKEVEPNF
jgi:hypothetical protein